MGCIVWLTVGSSRSFPSPRDLEWHSQAERGSLHKGLRVPCAYLQHSTCLPGVIVVFCLSDVWVPEGQDLSLVPVGWAQSLTHSRSPVSTFQWTEGTSKHSQNPGWRRNAFCVACFVECRVLHSDMWQNLGGLSHPWPPNKFNVGSGLSLTCIPPYPPN